MSILNIDFARFTRNVKQDCRVKRERKFQQCLDIYMKFIPNRQRENASVCYAAEKHFQKNSPCTLGNALLGQK